MEFDFNAYLERVVQWAVASGLRILLIVVLALIAMRAVRMLARRTFTVFGKGRDDPEFVKRTHTLSAIVGQVATIVVLAIAVMMVLKELGIDIGPVLAGAGILGLAVGFGAQNLVQDVIGGFFILLEDQIRVGDVVNIADKGGLVERVGLRMTVLRDLSGNVHYVRNGQITVVTNMTKDFSMYVFDVGVAYRENTDEVIQVLREVDEEMRGDPAYKDDILAPIEILGLDKFADSAVVIKARTKTRPIQQWRIGREFNRRLKIAFDARDIEIPFPHVTIYAGREKDGGAPPFRVLPEGNGRVVALEPGPENETPAPEPRAS